MSSFEQANVFASATAVIGFGGSNLHNSIFCHERTPVLEIGDARSYASGPDRRNNTQITLCDILQQPLVFVESFEEETGGLLPMSQPALMNNIQRAMVSALP